jgi:hypothetical protein
MADRNEQMPPPTCTGCGGLQRDLFAVERLKTPAYVLRIFRCPSCRSSFRLVGPSGKETDTAYRRRRAALRRARLAAGQPPSRAKDEGQVTQRRPKMRRRDPLDVRS